MGVIKFFDRLRAKPVPVRRRIVLVSTAVLWLLVVSVWWIAVSTRNSTKEFISLGEVLSPWKAITKTVSSVSSEAQEMVDGVLKSAATGTETLDVTQAGWEATLDSATDDVQIEWSGNPDATSSTREVKESMQMGQEQL